MIDKLEQYLLEAAGKKQSEVAAENPYLNIAFDNGKKRCGWVKPLPFSDVKKALQTLLPVLEGKERFVFVGIGGSGNGIKAVMSLFNRGKIYILDSLDPAAFNDILPNINDKTLIIPISKSGTTKETQLLANTFKEYYSDSWKEHFLWLTDLPSVGKLDSSGWSGAKKATIQLDGETDMGGRFSCPGSLIFLLPLFILLEKDFDALEKIYSGCCSRQQDIRRKSLEYVEKYRDSDPAFFNVAIEQKIKDAFFPWVVQLFQESLGSKKPGFFVKTASSDKKIEGFLPLKLDLAIDDSVVRLMCNMYFFQTFVGFYAAIKGINFVNQDYVEKYKAQMRKLEGRKIEGISEKTLLEIIEKIKSGVGSRRFIEIILYFYADNEVIERIKTEFINAFPDKEIFIFMGSDWNHHSYQAAFSDKNTFFVLALKSPYENNIDRVSRETVAKNIEALKTISKATHTTIEDKAVLVYLLQ